MRGAPAAADRSEPGAFGFRAGRPARVAPLESFRIEPHSAERSELVGTHLPLGGTGAQRLGAALARHACRSCGRREARAELAAF